MLIPGKSLSGVTLAEFSQATLSKKHTERERGREGGKELPHVGHLNIHEFLHAANSINNNAY